MNPYAPISAIPALPNQGGQANVPGLRRLWLIEARQLLGFIDPRTIPGAITDSSGWVLPANGLQLAEETTVLSFKFPASRGSYNQKTVTSIQGVLYEQTISLLIPKDHLITTLAIQRMVGRQWVAIMQDGNGLRKVVGTYNQPLRFTSEQRSNPNGYTFSWVGQTRFPAFGWADDVLLNTLTDSAEFSTAFDYDFNS